MDRDRDKNKKIASLNTCRQGIICVRMYPTMAVHTGHTTQPLLYNTELDLLLRPIHAFNVYSLVNLWVAESRARHGHVIPQQPIVALVSGLGGY